MTVKELPRAYLDPEAGLQRLSFVLRLLFPRRVIVAVGFNLIVASHLILLAMREFQSHSAFRYFIVDSFAPWLFWLVATLALVLSLWNWLTHRKRFFETENFVIPGLMALSASINYGLINYRIHLSSPDGFYIEQEAADAFKEFRDIELKARKETVHRQLTTYESLEQNMPEPESVFLVHRLSDPETAIFETVDTWCFEAADPTIPLEPISVGREENRLRVGLLQ